MVKQDGLEWVQDLFGWEPRWTREPDSKTIESLARKHLALEEDAYCDVQFHAQGAFNKLYKVVTDKGTSMMRVTLPVDPHNKTTSEVATIEFVRRQTDLPVPEIIAFNASSDNDLGFEWILMEMMPGQPLLQKWRKLSMPVKEELIKQLVCYQAKLFENRFEGIGSIVRPNEREAANAGTDLQDGLQPPPVVSRIVSHIFFLGDHLTHDVPRGPFQNSHDWLHARLTFTLNDQERILRDSEDEDDLEDAQTTKDIVCWLLAVLPKIFPSSQKTEATILFHDDLSTQNILVDDAGKLTAVLDWECVATLPLWRACQIPYLLEGSDRDNEPDRKRYPSDEGEEPNPDGLDSEGVCTLFWEHLLEYEQTQLRRLFMNEMEQIQPGWVEESRQATLKSDFERAVTLCDDGWHITFIQEWLDAYDSGEPCRLRVK